MVLTPIISFLETTLWKTVRTRLVSVQGHGNNSERLKRFSDAFFVALLVVK